MSGPFKMSGSQFLGKGNQSKKSLNQEVASAATYASPAKKEEEEKVVETRGKDGSITKSKGGKSSTYNETKRTKNPDGSITIVRTNDQGNNDTRTQSVVSKA